MLKETKLEPQHCRYCGCDVWDIDDNTFICRCDLKIKELKIEIADELKFSEGLK